MGYVDIHGHYAWQVDDGIVSKEMAIKALKKAKQQNISHIVATPHVVSGKTKHEEINLMKKRIQELGEIASSMNIQVFEGCELFLNDLYLSQIKSHDVIPLNHTKYLLCEFDVRKNMSKEPDLFYDRLFSVYKNGDIPVLAHCERYFKDKIDLDLIRDIMKFGTIIQINTSSLKHPKSISGINAYTLLKNNMVHVIATDTHRDCQRRYPDMDECFHLLEKQFDMRELNLLMKENPYHLLKGEEVENTHFVKKGFLRKKWERGE